MICPLFFALYFQSSHLKLHYSCVFFPNSPHSLYPFFIFITHSSHLLTKFNHLLHDLAFFGDSGVASPLVEAIPTRKVSAQVKNRIGPHHSSSLVYHSFKAFFSFIICTLSFYHSCFFSLRMQNLQAQNQEVFNVKYVTNQNSTQEAKKRNIL